MRTLSLAVLLTAPGAASADPDLQARIYPNDKLAQVTLTAVGKPLLGVGIETLGHEIIGGVYSNLLYDESFEHPAGENPATTSGGWYRQPGHAGGESVEVTADALAGNHSARLRGGAVIFNAGLNQQAPQGFAFTQGSSYML